MIGENSQALVILSVVGVFVAALAVADMYVSKRLRDAQVKPQCEAIDPQTGILMIADPDGYLIPVVNPATGEPLRESDLEWGLK